jgi:NAD(P)-dependent dehydrogenase (short-subunit alcohol dehydrogenase family)
MQNFQGKVAVVTGAASGIGLGTTERFLEEGMKVVMADVEQARLDREVERLSSAGGDVLGVRCDVRDPAEVDALRDRTSCSTMPEWDRVGRCSRRPRRTGAGLST